jgi:hypothetical protein
MLMHTNWSGAPACVALIEDVDRSICQLYNRAEASLRKQLGLDPIETPQDASPELGAADDANQAEIAPPAKEGSEQ